MEEEQDRLTALIKKRGKIELIKEIQKRGFITEQEIKLICRRLNSKIYNWGDIEVLQDLKITTEQTRKGLDWLKNKWKTPRGIERKNNPFGYREEETIETFKEFRLNSFTNRGNQFIDFWIPVYDVIGTKSNFQYIIEKGTASIIG